jgi:hypothetical protein
MITQRMNPAPSLYHVLQQVQHALQAGEPLQPHGAAMDPTGTFLTVPTHRGPATLRRDEIAQTLEAMRGRMQVHRTAALPAPAPPRPEPVRMVQPPPPAKAPAMHTGWLPLERTWAYQDWPTKDKPGKAPRRSLGNFDTEERTEATMAALRHNVQQARASGHEPLIKAMEKAMADAIELTKGKPKWNR